MAGGNIVMHDHVDRYVRLQRALGRTFRQQETSLHRLADFSCARSATHLTSALMVEWASAAPTPNAARIRFDVARALARFLHAEDARHEIAPADLLGRGRRRRPAPHILAPDQVAGILAEALKVPGRTPISPLTYHYLFGLLAATGLRVSEALALRLGDLMCDGLLVRGGKFGKSRLVPLHGTTRAALESYLSTPARPHDASDALFVLGHGQAPTATRAHVVFVRIVRQLGYRAPKGPGPRLHDLRHTFAVRSLEACGSDPATILRHMRALSTYLGHADIANTYWYLEATPVLLGTIASAAEATWLGGAA